MTQKDYEAVARAVKHRRMESRGVALRKVTELAADLADIFAQDNPNFKFQLFYDACGFTPEDRESVQDRTLVTD